MTNIISNILIGCGNFPFFGVLFTLPIFFFEYLHCHKINIIKTLVNYSFLLYLLCLFALVFLPLPTMTQASRLSTHDLQFIPFHFVADIIRETPFVWNQPETYLHSLFSQAVLQVLFNIFMTVPFGMFLRYTFNCSAKKVIVYTFLLSAFIETAQLTGLFFIYQGSYRLCDVDDLIANTLGGYMGYRLMNCLYAVIVSILSKLKSCHTVSYIN